MPVCRLTATTVMLMEVAVEKQNISKGEKSRSSVQLFDLHWTPACAMDGVPSKLKAGELQLHEKKEGQLRLWQLLYL